MKTYVDDIIVTDASGEKAVLYPKTKQEAVFGLIERLGNLEVPQITESTETSMPNSYAGRLEVVEIGGGESEQDKTTGAQLFDGALEQGSFDGVLNKIESAYCVRNSVNRPVTPNKTYTISSRVAKEASIFELDSEGNFLSILSSFASLPLTFTTSSNGHYIALVLRISDTTAITPNMVNDVMLNEGTEALPWEPYSGGAPSPSPDYPQEIKKTVVSEILTHGKNLLKVTSSTITQHGVTLTVNDDKSIKASGTVDGLLTVTIGSAKLKKGVTYIVSGCPNGGSDNSYRVDLRALTGVAIQGTLHYGADTPFTVEQDTTAYYTLRLASGAVLNNIVFKPMIREARAKDATYEPYTESVITLSQPIELYKIGAVQDVIEDGEVKRKLKKIMFDGDESWTPSSVLVGRYMINITNIKTFTNAICTQFIEGEPGSTSVNEFWLNSPHRQIIFNTSFATLDEWKAHLQTNPMTVVYQLVEKAVEELPIVDQIALNSLSTYDGITYADVVSDIPPTFKGKYGTSEIGGMVLEGKLAGLSGELYGISNADRIAALEATVVNNI